MNELKQAMEQALEALEEIALAGMSGTGMESEEGMRDWHARRAWEFIGIAARALPALRAALSSLPDVQTGWRPIETAPRDGTEFLAYRPLANRTHDPVVKIVRGVSYDNRSLPQTIPEGYDGTNYTNGSCRATLWQPLPPPPASSAPKEPQQTDGVAPSDKALWEAINDWHQAKLTLAQRRASGELMNADYLDAVTKAEERIDAHVSGVALPATQQENDRG
jgi:hypothetical protein